MQACLRICDLARRLEVTFVGWLFSHSEASFIACKCGLNGPIQHSQLTVKIPTFRISTVNCTSAFALVYLQLSDSLMSLQVGGGVRSFISSSTRLARSPSRSLPQITVPCIGGWSFSAGVRYCTNVSKHLFSFSVLPLVRPSFDRVRLLPVAFFFYPPATP